LELYQHDFSEFDGRDLDAHGEYGYRQQRANAAATAFWRAAIPYAYTERETAAEIVHEFTI
jgi:hypothetical protein